MTRVRFDSEQFRREQAPDSFMSAPLWEVAGQVTVVVAITFGFGAINVGPPRLSSLLLLMGVAGTILLGPRRAINKVVITLPVLLYLAWWTVSFLWTHNMWVYLRETEAEVPLVASLVVVFSLLPRRAIERALLAACYLGLAWAVGYTLLNPGLTMVHPDGGAGWHGSFGHKNAMAPFMIFAIIAIGTFGRRRMFEKTAIAACLFLLVMSRSTTGLVVAVALVALAWLLRRLEAAPPTIRPTIFAGGALFGITSVTLAVVYLPALVGIAGKDLTLSRRTDIWANVIEALQHHPWTGYGIGGAWIYIDAEPTKTLLRGLGFIVYHSHNGFLEIALQLGLIGLALFAVMVVSLARSSLALLSDDPALAKFTLLFVGLLVLTSISEVATFGIWLALVCALHSLTIRRRREIELTT